MERIEIRNIFNILRIILGEKNNSRYFENGLYFLKQKAFLFY